MAWTVERAADTVRLSLGECPAVSSGGVDSWMDLLAAGHIDALEAVARALEPTAQVRRVGGVSGQAVWEVRIGDEIYDEHAHVTLTKFSSGADFRFERTGFR